MNLEEFTTLLKPILRSQTANRTSSELFFSFNDFNKKNADITVIDRPATIEIKTPCSVFLYNGRKLVKKKLAVGTNRIYLNREDDFVIARFSFSEIRIVIFSTRIPEVPPL